MRLLVVFFVLVLFPAVLQGGEVFQSELGFPGAVIVEEISLPTAAQQVGYVTITVPYLDIHGRKKLGQGRCYFTSEMLKQEKRSPVYIAAHYPISKERASDFCEQGFLAVTPFCEKYPLEFVIGDSYNFMIALTQWSRRQSCADRSRFVIGGGSAGGYMTLAMGSEFFPIAALVSDLPCVNWAYGCNYLKMNENSSGCYSGAGEKSPLPVLALIVPGLRLATDIFGDDFRSNSWYTLSPISYVDRITAPTMVVCATGDMLCTFEQFTAREYYKLDASKFPADYKRDFDELTINRKSRVRFDQAISSQRLLVHVISANKLIKEYTIGNDLKLDRPLRSAEKAGLIDLPWSKDKQISLVVLDEGSPLAHLGHTRYEWNVSSKSFLDYNLNNQATLAQLTPKKLRRLMERFSGKLRDVARDKNGKKINRLNYKNLERRDIATGLLDYAQISEKHAAHLKDLYQDCKVKPLGKTLDLNLLRKIGR